MTAELYYRIRRYLRDLIRGTEWEGRVYCVGGCCRDEIMGEEIKDIDLAVEIPGGGVKFARWLQEKGLTTEAPLVFPRFSTAMLRLAEFPDNEIELVQTRKAKYTDRNADNPESAFGPLKSDALLRDLTINSLYYDISAEKVVDVTGKGVDDIHAHIMRTPVEADITFRDDPLRVLRCIRFACRYGWEIESETLRGMYRHVGRLTEITKPRLHNELNKILTCQHPVKGLKMLRDTGALRILIPELTAIYHLADGEKGRDSVWQQTLRAVELTEADPVMRMAALLHAVGKSRIPASEANRRPGFEAKSSALARHILKRMKYDKQFIIDVRFLIATHRVLEDAGDNGEKLKPRRLRGLIHECGSRERFLMLMRFVEAVMRSQSQGRRPSRLIRTVISRAESMWADEKPEDSLTVK